MGYNIAHVSSAPILWVTADQEMAGNRLAANILPMIQQSGLDHRIRSLDESNKRKTGKTASRLEWIGGGSLIPIGAGNPDKMRSTSIQVLIRDEISAWQDTPEGDPLALTLRATYAHEDTRKVYDTSTPSIEGQCRIWRQFLRGDQRYYYIRCLACGHAQTLRWRRENPETGEVTGIAWETDPETKQLVPGSVRYLCEACCHPHTNDDKTKLLAPEYGAEWRATATAVHPTVRSYHLSALYSPVGMLSWESCVRQWLEAWDVEQARPKDLGLLQAFYNTVLGEVFTLRGDKLRFEQVSSHRRHAYTYGEVPNKYAAKVAGSKIQVLTCAVDVQKDWLAVGVFGWTKGRRSFLIDYFRWDGPTDRLDDEGTWKKLEDLIERKVYVADDGTRYGLALTLVDANYQSSVVHGFVRQYASGVLAIKGEAGSYKAQIGKLFREIKTPFGEHLWGLAVDAYKERLHLALKHGWDGQATMPEGHWSCPIDTTDAQLKELTIERRVEDLDPVTRQRRGWKWIRPSGSRNELLDLSVYSSAALDLLAYEVCRRTLGLDQIVWAHFFEATETGLYFHHPS